MIKLKILQTADPTFFVDGFPDPMENSLKPTYEH